MGTRLRPLTDTIPKTLVPVQGKPMIEWQIERLLSSGISDIVIIGGYLFNKLLYLEKKYLACSLKLINNEDYAVYNNIYSLYLARDYLGDTIILEGDAFHTRNLFFELPVKSSYFIGQRPDSRNEWL